MKTIHFSNVYVCMHVHASTYVCFVGDRPRAFPMLGREHYQWAILLPSGNCLRDTLYS